MTVFQSHPVHSHRAGSQALPLTTDKAGQSRPGFHQWPGMGQPRVQQAQCPTVLSSRLLAVLEQACRVTFPH